MTILASEIHDVIGERTRRLLAYRSGVPTGRRRGWLVRRALVAADIAGLTLAFCAAETLFGSHLGVRGAVNGVGEAAIFSASLPLWVIAAHASGLYSRDEERTDHSTTDDFVGVFHLVTLCTFLLFVVATTTEWFNPDFGKLILFWLLASFAVTALRAAARSFCRRKLLYLQNTIIVGAGTVGQTLARKVLQHPEYGLNLVGFVDASPLERMPGLEHLTVLGSEDELDELVDLLDVERVIYAYSLASNEDHLRRIRSLNVKNVQVDIVPRFFDVVNADVDFHAIEGLPLCSLPPVRLSRSALAAKRGVDVAGALVGLTLLAPLFLIVAILIKLDSPGPVFFRQTRIGERGRPFRMWKFRSMIVDAEMRKGEFAHLNKHLRPGGDPRMFKIEGDPRATRVGRMLRRFSLVVLAQFLNVLAGEMSLVGPRPLIAEEIEHILGWASRRLDLRPGITGLWQVHGRDDIGFDEMVNLDYRYLTAWSVWRDITLIAQTFPAVVRKSG